jgi:signal transduction histidine kinase
MQTIELFSNQALEKSLSLSIEVDPMIPAAVVGDPTRLTQILNNLINNAIKFTEKGSIKVRLMTKKLQHDQVVVGFEVTDTGIGIPKQSIEQIFDSFKQASNDTTRKFGGTGLGLSIVIIQILLDHRLELGQVSHFIVDLQATITYVSR